jgi:hypothetical protein
MMDIKGRLSYTDHALRILALLRTDGNPHPDRLTRFAMHAFVRVSGAEEEGSQRLT